ncbi:class I SAM-dependent methyltransferase [Mucilaginibacter pallidiroseus]|uniref:Class I SAM-dependent methyltransferase n=1 Tax=Mucilaginibacter pallidiroseus TaxID=2599295 RepID=A0A563UJ52_9SPHI|nr:methyltransferase domain-containing protein [Mucilaginibacter pallidiroseus]TWR31402.1 class I SAM-dependent methyltransferase [Mucilaginibacter pallidiroseus]
MQDIFGQALADQFNGIKSNKLWINNKYGKKEEMPLNVYFRSAHDMPDLESLALNLCKGRVLDIGAGAGSHALLLQQQGFDISAMDISHLAVDIMKRRGVKHAFEGDIFNYSDDKYDTLILMMNGIGLCGTLGQFKVFLNHARFLLNAGGQLIFDSSDIAYLYNGKPPVGAGYYGELDYQYVYKGKKSDWFKWLYIDLNTLTKIALEENWTVDLKFDDGYDQYLVILTPIV